MATSKSPSKKKRKLLSFYDALRKVVNGAKATRIEWRDEDNYLVMIEGKLNIFLVSDRKAHPLIVHELDILADDWIIL